MKMNKKNSILFTKVHGNGNDFVLVNALDNEDGTCSDIDPGKLSELARDICNRHTGVGADGMVLILPSLPNSSERADVRMRIFNSDGSEAQMCGNAIRCVARYLYERGLVCERKIRVDTLAGIMVPEIVSGGKTAGNKTVMVRVDMGEPRLERSEIPMSGAAGKVVDEKLEVNGKEYRVTAVSMGNPHCVIFVDDVDKFPLVSVGSAIERHPSFPERTNVEFVQVLNWEEVRMRVWERGAGETLACGTGACAATVAGVLNNHTGRTVTVHLKGGDLTIEWGDNNHVYMTGPAEEVFEGRYFL